MAEENKRAEKTPLYDGLSFGEFRLTPATRSLTRNSQPVTLGARALDLLIALAERPGQVLSKAELFATVWPNISIEESNLRVHIAALRRALGDGRSGQSVIASVPGRGYTFIAAVEHLPGGASLENAPQSVVPNNPSRAPMPLVRIIGRDEIVSEIAAQLPRQRLVTITGTGGIGKTAAALTVAQKLAGAFRGGVLLVDLAALASPMLVAPQLASLLRLPAPDTQPLHLVIAHLQTRNLLILFDNCEHVIETVSAAAEAILAGAPDVHILATSREPLRAMGEWTYRLGPLAVPPVSIKLTVAELRRFPAVQLLEERARACDAFFEMTDDDATAVAEICARLDGVPLAIELAATRVPLFGLRGLAERLDDRFTILTKGRRTALPRHQTLTAMIDWSYEILSEEEKMVWRRFAVFRDAFAIKAADAIGHDRSTDDFSIVDILDSLVEKSLVSVDLQDSEPKYRLLESLRLYAFGKLLEHAEADSVRRRHAEYWYEHSARFGANWVETPSAQWLNKHRGDIADIRAALDWAFAPEGDGILGMRIAAASSPLWFKMLLLPELREHLEHAIALASGVQDIDNAVAMRLHLALGHCIFHALGPVPEGLDALGKALAIAERLGDVTSQLQVLWALFGIFSTRGDYEPMMACVDRMSVLAKQHSEPVFAATYNRVAALGLHLVGEQERALRHAREAVKYAPVQRHDGGFVYDHTTSTNSHYCRILWLMGQPDRAEEVIRSTIERAPLIDQPFAFGYFLAFGACPVSIWNRDVEALRKHVSLLLDDAIGVPRTVWRMEGEFYRRVLEFLDDPDEACSSLHRRRLIEMPLTLSQAERLSTFSCRLLRPESLASTIAGTANWCAAEVLRAKGETLINDEDATTWPEAERLFLRAIGISRNQKALSWELRTSISLALLWQRDGRTTQARHLLSAVCEKFAEGAATKDLMDAKALLNSFR